MTAVYDSRAINDSLARITVALRSTIDQIGDYSLVEESNKPIVHTRLQSLFGLKFNNDLDKRLFELLVTHATLAEKMAPGAFDRCLRMTLEYFELYMKGFHNGVFEKIPPSITIGSLPTKADIINIIDEYTIGNLFIKDIVTEAVNMGGFGGKIIIEKTQSSVCSVELSRGYTFDVTPAFSVSAKVVEPRVFCIDGYIESVSEVHHLLEIAAEIKEPALLFVRGLSNDVIHTLKVNYDRGSLKIIPIIVKFDLDGINTLNDIAIVSGGDVVSSNKGELISSIKFTDAPRIESATVYQTKVVITNSSTHKNVATQVAFLLNKRTDETVISDVGTLYDKRIKSLSPNQVTIRLPDTKDYVVNAQLIDYTLRAIKSAVDYGIDKNGLAISDVASMIYSSKCVSMLLKVGSVVTI